MSSSKIMNSDNSLNSSNKTLHSHSNCDSKESNENPYKTILLILLMVITSLTILIIYQLYQCFRRKNHQFKSNSNLFQNLKKKKEETRSNLSICPLTDFRRSTPTISLPSPVATHQLTNQIPNSSMIDHQINHQTTLKLKPPSEISTHRRIRSIPGNIYIPI
ncbi:hypothetical protein DFH28DRAFT_987481 [Melampsora americana]|nr:hypothetical protein DFH28DRAFT_987481 [Melampsora americana]